MIWWGEGRWDWNTVYNMPIPIRKLWTKKINEILEARNAPAPSSTNTPKKSAAKKTT